MLGTQLYTIVHHYGITMAPLWYTMVENVHNAFGTAGTGGARLKEQDIMIHATGMSTHLFFHRVSSHVQRRRRSFSSRYFDTKLVWKRSCGDSVARQFTSKMVDVAVSATKARMRNFM